MVESLLFDWLGLYMGTELGTESKILKFWFEFSRVLDEEFSGWSFDLDKEVTF